jgi:hypothetical protein
MQRNSHDGYRDPSHNPGEVQEDRLKGVKPHGAVLIVGRKHQEQDSGDEPKKVTKCPRRVVADA